MTQKEIYRKSESYKIIGACMQVHSKLGSGFLEAVYQEALSTEFEVQNIPYRSQVKLDVYYGQKKLKKFYVADFVCYEDIVVEIKSVFNLPKVHYSQLLNYLKATNNRLGILVNFGESSLVYKRILNGFD